MMNENIGFTEGAGLSDTLFNADGLANALNAAGTTLERVMENPAALSNTDSEIQVLRNDSLPNEAWRDITEQVIQENARRLSLVTAFRSATVQNPLGTTEIRVPRISRGDDVQMGVDPSADGSPEHTLDFSDLFITLPWYWRRYRFPVGLVQARPSYVNEIIADGVGALAMKLEKIAFTGGGKFAGRTVNGVKQLPSANKQTRTNKWGASGTTGPQYLTNIEAALDQFAKDGYSTSGVRVFLPAQAVVKLISDYSTEYKESIRARIGENIGSISVSDALETNDAVFLPQDSSMVWADAVSPRAITWTDPSGLSQVVLCVAKGAPGIRLTYDGKAGAIYQS